MNNLTMDGDIGMTQDFQLDNNWTLYPLDGDTGQAYLGEKDGQKVFIKRNTSPFLAALSREGLTPKLVWSKRLSNGDIVTAQEWLDGKLLTPQEVGRRNDVIQLLSYLHHSQSLKNMLIRVGGKCVTPIDLLQQYRMNLPRALDKNHYLMDVFSYLEDHLPELDVSATAACHGDLIHKNWMTSAQQRLYIVDWDASMIADPALDLGTVMGRYVPMRNWKKWLEMYGKKPTEETLEKIYWYSGIDFLLRIKNTYLRNEYAQSNLEIMKLKKIYLY